MEFGRKNRSIIVHLPIDLTAERNYENPLAHINAATNTQENKKIRTFDIHDPINNCPYTEEYKKYKNNMTTLMSEGIRYDNSLIKIASTDHSNKFHELESFKIIHCWHCSDIINGSPVGIPSKHVDGTFHIRGYFCSFNCALTYNFESPLNDSVIQEREGFLRMMHRLSEKSIKKKLIYAPPKEALSKFGGIMSFDEFHRNNSYVSILYEPHIRQIAFVEDNKQVDHELKDTAKETNNLVSFIKNTV